MTKPTDRRLNGMQTTPRVDLLASKWRRLAGLRRRSALDVGSLYQIDRLGSDFVLRDLLFASFAGRVRSFEVLHAPRISTLLTSFMHLRCIISQHRLKSSFDLR
jgi:hypothetical protein